MKIVKIILIFVLVINTTAVAQIEVGSSNPLNLSDEHYKYTYEYTLIHSASMLQALGIASKTHAELGWETISRRNAFEMLYLAYTCRAGYLNATDDKLTYVEENSGNDWFVDAQLGTYDNDLATLLLSEGLINGKGRVEDGRIIVDLDGNLTYYEALTAITNIFLKGYKDYERWYRTETIVSQTLENKDLKYPRYEFAKLIGLINQKDSIHYTVLEIEEEKMEDNISAYEYMNLLYCAMLTPYLYHGDYGINPGHEERLIDWFIMKNCLISQ